MQPRLISFVLVAFCYLSSIAHATPFTNTSPDGTALPSVYPEAGGVAMILYGANGNIYYQFSEPAGSFVGFQNTGSPTAFRGNPFTINDPLTLDCGVQTCEDYFGNAIVKMEVRFSAQDGDTQAGGFDEDDISLLINGTNIGNWSDVPTQNTNTAGTTLISSQLGYGNGTFDTGWFSSTDAGLLGGILSSKSITTQVFDDDPNDNYWNFRRGNGLSNAGLERVSPAYTLEKRARSGSFSGPDLTNFSAVGETIYYTYDVVNTGNVRIDNLSVDDDILGAVACNPSSIQTGETSVCQATHVVSQEEFDTQAITNVATATGDPEFGQLGTLSDTVTVTGPGRNPAITLDKTPDGATYTNAGELITYSFVVKNTGDVTLTSVDVTDPRLPSLSCTSASLAPDEELTCSASYTVTQIDVDNGSIVNTATVNATDPVSSNVNASDTATHTAVANPAFSVVKSTSSTPTAAGQTLVYDFNIRNDGNAAISGVVVTDAKCAAAPALVSGDTNSNSILDVGETHLYQCTSIAITQAEVDAGTIDNTVSVSGTPSIGTLSPISTTLQTPVTRTSGFSLLKATSDTPSAVGQQLTYSFTVGNTGNASLSSVSIADGKCSAAPTLQSGDGNNDSELGPTETWVYECLSVPVTQAELDAGQVDNTATVSGQDPSGAAVTPVDATLSTPTSQTPSFDVTKSTNSAPSLEGDTLVYEFELQNTGNVTIFSPAFSDPKCASAVGLTGGDTDNDTALDVGETHTYSCTSVPVTQAEVDGGSVSNTVTVTGTPAGGTLAATSDTVNTIIAAAPALGFDKRLGAASLTSYDATTDVLLYDFVVTNTGNVTLTSAITINDPSLDAAASCPALSSGLAPGASTTCTGQKTVSQADIDAGNFTNTATASSGPTTSAPDSVTVNANQMPALSMVKDAVAPASFAPGQTITYTYTITNTGNTTVPDTRTMSVTDNRTPVSCPAIPAGGLEPTTGTLICTASYVIQPGDVSLGTVTNTATATDGVVTSPTDSATVPSNFSPALSLTKTADPLPAGFSGAGDTITYSYVVQNTGGASFSEVITVTDDKINNGLPFACWTPAGPTDTLDPDPNYGTNSPPTNINGETASCTGSYVVTQADIDSGSVLNEAVANTVFAPSGPNIPVASAPVTETVTFAETPSLSVAKSAAPADLTTAAPGDVITYTFVVQNTGTVTIDDVVPVDTGPTFNGAPATAALSAFTVTVGPDSNTDGQADTLAPTETAEFTATYTLTQADIDAAAGAADPSVAIANTGSATGDPRNGTLDPVTPSGATTGFAPEPSFTVSKQTASVPALAGDTLDYTFFVENTGNLTITGVSVADAKCAAAPALQSGDLNSNSILDVTETWQYTCTSIAVTQAEIDAGQVDNTATATGTTAEGALTPAEVTLSTPVAEDGRLVVAKSTSSAPTAAGETLVYQFTVTNPGNVSITPTAITDAKCAAAPTLQSGDLNSDTAINPTETWIYQCTSIPVTQDEVNAAAVDNTVTVSGTTPTGDPITPATDDISTPIAASPLFSVDKTTSSTPAAAGDTLVYQFAVSNDGNVSISNLIPTDAKCAASPTLQSGDANNNASLDPTETFTYQCTSIPVTQVEIDAGQVSNTVSVSGNDPTGAPITLVSDTENTPVSAAPSWTLAKTTTSMPTAAGQTLDYSFELANTGNVSISAITLTDAKCAAAPVITVGTDAGTDNILSPNEVWTLTCTSIPVTQAEIDAGQVDNSVSAVGTPSGGTLSDATSSSTTAVASAPGLSIAKATTSTPMVAGDTLVYDFTVRNLGNTSLSSVVVTDPKCSAPATLQSGDANTDTTLNPTETWIYSCTSIPVTQAEVDAGEVVNTAQVDAQDPMGTNVPPATGSDTTEIGETAAWSVVKATSSAPTAAGETLDYTFTVSNDGNVSISSIVVTDAKCAAAPALQSGDTNSDVALNPTETWVYGCTSVAVTQAEVDAGVINNSVSLAGSTPMGDPLPPAQDSLGVGVVPSAGIEAIKTITTGGAAVGDTVIFEITARNTGNVTLSGVDVVDTLTRADATALPLGSGPTFTSADAGSSAGTLLPGETATYEATYTLVQADLDAGGLSNTATASGTPPTGAPVSDISDDGVPGGTDDPTVLTIAPMPSMAMVKLVEQVTKLDASTASSFDEDGDRIDYLFTVTNTGNVTITDPISITDPLITGQGNTITCDAGPLAPNASLECRGSYTVGQSDVDAGSVTNTASATDGITTSDDDSATVNAVQTPALETSKIARPLPPATFTVGATATYDYVVTNTGNTTITTPIVVSDNLIPAADLTCDPWPGSVAPGETYACVGTYIVTVNDVDLGSVTNLASATDGTTTSPPTSQTIPDGAVPALSIAKATTTASFAAVGDQLDYSFLVTNSGTRAFVQPITVTDDRIGTLTCWTPTGGDPDFIAGETATCTASYTVTQADLDAGTVTNNAFARTEFGTAPLTEVVSPSDDVTINAAAAPALDLVKSAALPSGRTTQTLQAGDLLTYTLSVENSGNQTVTNISVSDPLLGLSCTIPTLAPTVTDTSCTGTYTLLQSDIDAGEIENAASAAGSDPTGGTVADGDTLITPLPTPVPAISLVKTSTPNNFAAVGDTVVYRFAVTNDGNVTLSNVEVTDPLIPSFSCVITSLAPLVTDATCSVPYAATQDDVDRGFILNTASVSGDDPSGTTIGGTGEVTTDGPAPDGSMDVTKTLSTSGTTPGAVISYTIRVVNTGNVTLGNVVPNDTLTRRDGTPLSLDGPVTLISGDTNNDDLLAVDEVWIYAAQYTLVQEDVNQGGVDNSVEVTATDPASNPVVDISDDGDDSDGFTDQDPTEFIIDPGPALEATKTVVTAGTMVGDTVEFEITVLNLGNVDLNTVTIDDTLTRIDGTPLALTTQPTLVGGDTVDPAILNVGELWVYRATYILVQQDVDAGGIRNTATANVLGPSGVPISDIADNGIDTDGNTSDDPTEMTIPSMPGLELEKTVSTAGVALGDVVEFTVTARNTGNVTLSSVSITDTLTRNDGAALTVSSGPTFDGATGGSTETALLPNGELSYIVTYALVQEDIDAGGITNTATGTATTPTSVIVSDVSDDPTATGTGPNDPTVLIIAQVPEVTTAKAVVGGRVLFPTIYETTFEITLENTGNTTLTDAQVIDDLVAYAAPATLLSATYPPVVSVTGLTSGGANAGFDGAGVNTLLSAGATLAPMQTATITVTATYSTATGAPAPGLNTATTTSTELPDGQDATVISTTVDTDGDGVPDGFESTTEDRDGDGIPDASDYDPTGYFYCEETGRMLTGAQITVTGGGATQTGVGVSGPINIVRDGVDGSYQFFVTAPGSYTLSYTNPSSGTPSTTLLATTGATQVSTLVDVLTGTTTTNPRILGSGEFGTTGTLADFSPTANPAFYTTFVINAGDPQVFSNNIPYTGCAVPDEFVATKAVIGSADVRLGDAVSYLLTYTLDAGAPPLSNVSIVDILPTGISYVPNSAVFSLNAGAETAVEPLRTGNRLTWAGQSFDPGDVLAITINGRVMPNAPTGALENRTVGQSPTGLPISNVATAIVERLPEHVFDCSDVIGKVFDDKNRNGYQDGVDNTAITDQSVSGKGKLTAPATSTGEPGLAGVRVATANGTLITTDEYGRFHVPCAELPSKIGTNFILKVDERSLPSGYRMTTENPRVVRLTAGKFAKMNFGATIGRVIDINLNHTAFESGGEPSAKLASAVRNLTRSIAKEPSVVRLTYMTQSAAETAQARTRLRAIERLLKQEWRKAGTYKLMIEKSIRQSR